MTLDEERHAIREELEMLRAQGARRQELSLHACKRLFFDLSIRPSIAAVRDLTQTGSASDIPKDIDSFWERIRAASKIRVGIGAIPKALEEKAGELLGDLFEAAQIQANVALENKRQEMATLLQATTEQTQKAKILHEITEEALHRAEKRIEEANLRIQKLEGERRTVLTQRSTDHENALKTVHRLNEEKEILVLQLKDEQNANSILRNRIDTLHAEMRQNTEHYAQQIKDAITEAERRIKPMLVELDSLRGMASTYQSGIRDASRKEFDFIQQISVAKIRADRLEGQLHTQSEEIDVLTHEINVLRTRHGVSPMFATLLNSLAASGRLSPDEFASMGTAFDEYVVIPSRCPKCEAGEPELSQTATGYELFCPECDHSSGMGQSRFEATARFFNDQAGRTAPSSHAVSP
jgi:hypothetical protein